VGAVTAGREAEDPVLERWWGRREDVRTPYPLWCRGNVGEVFPNVISLLGASLLMDASARGQERWALDTGMISRRQLVEHGWSMIEPFAGYLYVNVSLGRIAAVRAPGMQPSDIDEQLYGLIGAPPYEPRRGDRDLLASLRMLRTFGRQLYRPERFSTAPLRDEIDRWCDGLPDLASADRDALLGVVRSTSSWIERGMHALLVVSGAAGFVRAVLERITEGVAGDAPDRAGAVNVLTGGLGSIESAEPARELWAIGRRVAASPELGEAFDAGIAGLLDRLRTFDTVADVTAFLVAFDGFLERHGARGPDEIELASSTWGTDPEIALAAVERLRHAPDDRDPVRTQRRLADERDRLAAELRTRLRGPRRGLFDRAMRASACFAAEREATKAALVRSLHPARLAVHELAARAAIDHDDAFLVSIEELPALLDDPASFDERLASRRARQQQLAERVPPFWFDGTIPPPASWTLRQGLRRPDGSTRTLTGMGVCPGIAVGRACLVTDPADPGGLEPGDILVAPLTDPAWTPLFLAVAGVVVDVGAQQSHAAIIARELGIPAVVSVTGASTTIPDGARITVDGTNGRVVVH
jgi:rifampicin phosphotransferase